jgi:hypothetical protein
LVLEELLYKFDELELNILTVCKLFAELFPETNFMAGLLKLGTYLLLQVDAIGVKF